MKRSVCAAFLALAACGGKEEPAAVQTAPVFRDRSVMISTPAVFDAAAFMGEWNVIARIPEAGLPPCAAIVEFTATDGGYSIAEGCAGGAAYRAATGPMTMPGRFATDPAVWVLWVAQDGGSAIIGRPDGSMGMIINRGTSMNGDRYRAAREVMDFNGYDVSQLVR